MTKLADIAATPIREISNREPVRVSGDTPVIDVIESLRQHGRGAAVIEDDTGVAGIFTERDVMKRIDHSDHSWHSKPVREVMTEKLATIRPDQSLRDAIDQMIAGHFRHLPIVDSDGSLSGVLSIRDLLAYIVEHFPADFVNLPSDPDHEASKPWGG